MAAVPPGDRVVGLAATPDGGGYWVATAGGSVFGFGNAPVLGSLAGSTHASVVGIKAARSGIGFWLTTAMGNVAAGGSTAPGGIWACIRQHESGGNYATNTGNGYYGAYQFSLPTWQAVGGQGLPSQASPAEQDARALTLQQRSGWGQWSTARGCGA